MSDRTLDLFAKVLMIGVVWFALLATVALAIELLEQDRVCERTADGWF